MKVAKALAFCLSGNTTILHLDISQNLLNNREISIISEGVASNHKLIGFHIREIKLFWILLGF